MADPTPATSADRTDRVIRRMVARDRDEAHRASSPLELLVDLSFVVAVAQVASQLHHAISDGHVLDSLPGYLMVFFAIWWAWMNFTWFASAFDVDDVPYRLLTLVQISGVLVIAAGVPKAFDENDFLAITLGYVLMRLAMVAQWLRAARAVPEERAVALHYAIGISVVQVGWLLRLALPDTDVWAYGSFAFLVLCEIAVPIWAERAGPMTPWHPAHIAERYGLFTIIVIGECILAGTVTVQAAFTESGLSWSLIGVASGGLVIVFAVWWCYFARDSDDYLRDADNSPFVWGYLHYFVFAAIAATGAGLQVVADTDDHHSDVTALTAAYSVAVPLAIYFVVLAALHTRVDRQHPVARRYVGCAVGVLLLTATAEVVALPLTMLAIATLLVVVVALDLWRSGAEPAMEL